MDHKIIHKAVEKTIYKYCWVFPETTDRTNQFSVILSFLMGIVYREFEGIEHGYYGKIIDVEIIKSEIKVEALILVVVGSTTEFVKIVMFFHDRVWLLLL
jgi:hypothetical protein